LIEVMHMPSTAEFAQIAALAGDPARAAMLHALIGGRALTASELARVAAVSPQTASGHLAQMTELGLLLVKKQGRHRYHRLASRAVAQMLESIMQVAADRATPDGWSGRRRAARGAHLLRPSRLTPRRGAHRRHGRSGIY